ncbi:BQ5605_C024g09781 [Microbotryum silenes-dioicae]|uniref:BQ5605_C024g09781 protein n=1 Tax=Microbotryum silenes-dioicae TaxID=796604 RepID=A0A2X0PL41_9BASI|nr:BQ5605_C024g09781 [Microbotryum silenes-dioicae]
MIHDVAGTSSGTSSSSPRPPLLTVVDGQIAPVRLPTGRILSRSSSLIVSARSGKQLDRPARPRINFALPPTPPLQDRDLNAPLPPSPASPPSPLPGLFKKLGRSLSQSKSTLARRVSGSPAKREGRAVSPTAARNLTSSASSSPSKPPRSSSPLIAPTLVVHPAPLDGSADVAPAPTPPVSAAAAAPAPAHAPVTTTHVPKTKLKRSFRAQLGRSKSEGNHRPVSTGEEDRMDQLLRRTELASRREESARTRTPSDIASGFFWSDSLGICWDGREEVRPDLLAPQPAYSSDADFVPQRVVYASTLSTFPPRPPLKSSLSADASSPTLSPANQVIAEYRALHGRLPPATPVDLGPPLPLSSEVTPIATPRADLTARGGATAQDWVIIDRRFPPGVQGRPKYARSVASESTSASAASEARFDDAAPGRESQDSSTSLESMRETSPTRNVKLAATTLLAPPSASRFVLHDDGPARALQPAHLSTSKLTPTRSISPGSSSVDSGHTEWVECEEQ